MKNLVFVSLLIFTFSCEKEKAVSIEIKVMNDKGSYLSDVSVKLNGNEMGRTDAKGFFHTEMELRKGEHRLELSKENYSSFQKEVFHYKESENAIKVKATLHASTSVTKEAVGEIKEEVLEDDFPLSEEEAKAKIVEETPLILNPYEEADMLLNLGNPVKAIQVLETVSEESPDYLKAMQKMGEIYLSFLENPEKALEIYQSLAPRDYKDQESLSIYTNEAIAYFYIGESKLQSNRKESTEAFVNTMKITKKLSKFLKKSKSVETVELVYYYRALAAHRLWQISPNKDRKIQVRKEWDQYQKFAKNLKTRVKDLLSKSEAFTKEVSL